MAITLPFPVRVAAGILATGIDRVRSLPEDLPAIPVTLVGNALKLSMKVQQEIAALANRGDELLGGVVNAPQENPSWAKFDDDEPVKPAQRTKPAPGRSPTPAKPGASGSPAAAPAKAPINTPPDLIAGPKDTAGSSTAGLRTRDIAGTADVAGLSTPEATAMPPVTTTAMAAAIEVSDELVDLTTETTGPAGRTTELPGAGVPADPTSGTAKIRAAERALDAEEQAALGAFEAGQVPDEVLDSVVIGETEELTEGLQVPTELIEEVLAGSAAEALLEEVTEIEAAEELLAEVAEIESVEELLEEAAEIEATGKPANGFAAIDTAEIFAAGDPDVPPAPVVFGETDDLTEGLPITDELIEQFTGDADGPAALPGYDSMTLAQVRGHLRELTPADVTELLTYEQNGDNRAPFLTLLSNRLVTLDAQNS